MVVSAIDPKPPESHFTSDGLYALVILPTGTGRVKAYVRGTYTTATFGYVKAGDPVAFIAFSSLTAASADPEEVFLEPGPGVQVYVDLVGATDTFIALSGGY